MISEESRESLFDAVEAESVHLWQLANNNWMTDDDVGLTPEQACEKHTVFAFARLAETLLSQFPKSDWPTEDVGIIAHTAHEFFKKRANLALMHAWGPLLTDSLHRAVKAEFSKIEFPRLNYERVFRKILEQPEEELDTFGGTYNPKDATWFAERVFSQGLLRVRGLDTEIREALAEFIDLDFPKFTTRQECADRLSWLPPEVLKRELELFDAEFNKQSVRSPETVALLLEGRRNYLVGLYTASAYNEYSTTIEHTIRCGVLASLFLSMEYRACAHAADIGFSKEGIARIIPTETALKDKVVKTFATYLFKEIVTRERSGRNPYADLSDLLGHYEDLLPIWKEASATCQLALNSNLPERRERWRTEMQRTFPLLANHPDLIGRLPDPRDWSTQFSETLREGHRTNKVEHIALEHAARLSGARPYVFALSTLQDKLRKLREKKDVDEL